MNPSGTDRRATLELIGLAREGDRTALNALALRYLPRLKRMARGKLPAFARDHMDTDDLVQEVWRRTLSNLPSFHPAHELAFDAYLRKAMLGLVQNEVRNATRRLQRSGGTNDLGPRPPSPLDQVIGQEDSERFESALERLPAATRELLILRIEMQCTYEEIATVVGKPSADAARMAVKRAVLQLADQMRRGRRPGWGG